jgi:hypothetical protein
MGKPTLALPLFGQALLNSPCLERDALKTKALFPRFQKGERGSFFCFSRQILQIFIGNCEPHRSKTGFVGD